MIARPRWPLDPSAARARGAGGEGVRIGVVGGGAWGTALAQVAARAGPVILWAREPDVVAAVNDAHENRLFLPGVPLSPHDPRDWRQPVIWPGVRRC